MIGRIYGDADREEIKIKPRKVDPARAKLVNGDIVADTGDMILVQQSQQQFKDTYEEFLRIEIDNQNKIKALGQKIKKTTNKFQDFLNINNLISQDGQDFVSLGNIEVNSKGAYYDNSRMMNEAVQDFRKLLNKTNDQIDRVDQYLNELLTSTEFEQLTKKLETIGVSFTKLKKIGDHLGGKVQIKREKEELFREEIMTLKMLNRDLIRRNMIEKIRGIHEYQKNKEQVQKIVFENLINGTNPSLVKSEKVNTFLRGKNEAVYDMSVKSASNPMWFKKHKKKKVAKKQVMSKLNILKKHPSGSTTKNVEHMIDSMLNL